MLLEVCRVWYGLGAPNGSFDHVVVSLDLSLSVSEHSSRATFFKFLKDEAVKAAGRCCILVCDEVNCGTVVAVLHVSLSRMRLATWPCLWL